MWREACPPPVTTRVRTARVCDAVTRRPKINLDVVRPPEVEVLADDRFKEEAPGDGAVQDRR